MADYRLLEDGTSKRLLEDGTSFRLLESSGGSSSNGSAAITESADVAAGVGTDKVFGVAAITEGADTPAGTGTDKVFGIAAILETADAAAGAGTEKVFGIAAISESADASDSYGYNGTFGIAALVEGPVIIAGAGVSSGGSAPDPVADPPSQDAGSSSNRNKIRARSQRYILRIDGQEFPCRTLKDALDLLERAKTFAKKVAQERMRAATERKTTFKPLPEPKVAAGNTEMAEAVSEAQREIKAIVRRANMDMELMHLMHQQIQREEDEELMWLM